jgi:anti-anti-sigma factor
MVGILFGKDNVSTNFHDLGGLTELVRGNEQLFLDRLMPAVRRQSIVLDLESVTRIDAAGLAALITLHCEACKTGHKLTVSHPSRHVREILDLVGLDRILLAEDEPEPGMRDLQFQESAA